MLVFLKKRMVTHPLFQGWLVGLEPTASRATIWRASQLRHSHHITTGLNPVPSLKGFEPPTHGLEGRCSIQLSYGHFMFLLRKTNRGDRIRTCDLLLPKQAL